MKKIRVNISKIKNHYYAKIPDIVAKQLKIENGQDVNISIYNNDKFEEQFEIWDIHPEDVDEITFTILGPGWVKTKIHEQSIRKELANLDSYKETKRRIIENDFVEMKKVVESILWILSSDKTVVGGRNFSTAHDPWGTEELNDMLISDKDTFKLRRFANSTFKQQK